MRISAELQEGAVAMRDAGTGSGTGAGDPISVEEGLARKAEEFREKGGRIYLEQGRGD